MASHNCEHDVYKMIKDIIKVITFFM